MPEAAEFAALILRHPREGPRNKMAPVSGGFPFLAYAVHDEPPTPSAAWAAANLAIGTR